MNEAKDAASDRGLLETQVASNLDHPRNPCPPSDNHQYEIYNHSSDHVTSRLCPTV